MTSGSSVVSVSVLLFRQRSETRRLCDFKCLSWCASALTTLTFGRVYF